MFSSTAYGNAVTFYNTYLTIKTDKNKNDKKPVIKGRNLKKYKDKMEKFMMYHITYTNSPFKVKSKNEKT